jgi:ligand-binding sensor domain-containing protein
MTRTSGLLLLLLLFSAVSAFAQYRPVGNWRAHLPYNQATGIAGDGITNYVTTAKGFYSYNTSDRSFETFSKVEGLHDTNPVGLAYDAATNSIIIGYQNSNIDLYRNHSFKVLPDLKNKSSSASKAIRHIYSDQGLAYLSTGLGIVVIDLDRQEVKETYVFSRAGQTIPVNAVVSDDTFLYAASDGGLFRIARSNPAPQVFGNWQVMDTSHGYSKVALLRDTLFAASAGISDSLFRFSGPGLAQRVWYRDSTHIVRLDAGDSILYVGVFTDKGQGRCYHFSAGDSIVDSTSIGYPGGVVEAADGRIWMADAYQGMGLREALGNLNIVIPDGPGDADNTALYARNNEVWVAHGGVYTNTNDPRRKTTGLSHFTEDHWMNFNAYNHPLFKDSVQDFLVLEMDQRSGTLYAGTAESGIYERKADGSERIIKQGELQGDNGIYPARGVAVDQSGALWVNQYGLDKELAVRDADGDWFYYSVPRFNRLFANRGAEMMVDDLNQKWYISQAGGVIIYNDGGTPDMQGDDDMRNLTMGQGNGGLPSNNVLCLAKDRDGAVWIGTDLGIGIAGSPGQLMQDKTSDVELRVVQYDQFAGILFSNESVNAIAVDGANRKWIGTSNGVWLLSPDASKIINRFTVDNAPLPSNIIQSIAVDGVSGEVYIGTEDGLVSYHGTATEGSETAQSIHVFPHPIATGYTGPITMRGFTTDADVRITDIAGQLVYRAKATGGSLVWNGLDYTGHRPQSGVLLIFASSRDGAETAVGKMMFMH